MFFVGLITKILERQEVSRTAEVEFLRNRVMDLETRILDMKREGFQPPPAVHQFHQRELLNGEIMGAIESVSKEGTTLYNDLLDHARALQLTDMPDDVIADQIIKGSSFEDFD